MLSDKRYRRPAQESEEEPSREEQDGARICSDYYFMSTDERSMPMLALKSSR